MISQKGIKRLAKHTRMTMKYKAFDQRLARLPAAMKQRLHYDLWIYDQFAHELTRVPGSALLIYPGRRRRQRDRLLSLLEKRR